MSSPPSCPALKRAFQTKFPEAWRSNLPFLPVLVKVQVFTKNSWQRYTWSTIDFALSNNIDPMCTFNRNKHFPPTFVLCIAECCKEAGKIALLWRSKLESKIRVSGQLLYWLCSTNMNFLGNNKSKMLYFDLSIFTFYQLEHKSYIFHISQASGKKQGEDKSALATSCSSS